MLRLGIEAAIALGLAGAVAQLVDYGALDLRVRALDSDTHASVFGVISLLALAAAAWAAGVSAVVNGERRAKVLLLGTLLLRARLRPTRGRIR